MVKTFMLGNKPFTKTTIKSWVLSLPLPWLLSGFDQTSGFVYIRIARLPADILNEPESAAATAFFFVHAVFLARALQTDLHPPTSLLLHDRRFLSSDQTQGSDFHSARRSLCVLRSLSPGRCGELDGELSSG